MENLLTSANEYVNAKSSDINRNRLSESYSSYLANLFVGVLGKEGMATRANMYMFEGQYGTAISYTLGTILLPAKFVISHILEQPQHYVVFVWVISRLFSVMCGVGTVGLAYLVALKLFDKKAALLGAAFTATSFYHTMNKEK